MSDVLRRYFWTAYDHLGGIVAYNLLWSLLSLPWIGAAYMLLRFGFSLGGLFLPGAVVLAGVLLFGSPATVLLFIVCAYWARGDEFNMREILLTGRRLFWRATALGGSLIVATGLILVNMFFYQQLGGWLGALLSGLMIWLLLLAGIMALYLFPVLVTQEGSVWATLRQSLLLAVDNLKWSLTLLLGAIFFLAVGLASGLGLFCGVMTAWALLMSMVLRALLPKYTGEALPVEVPRGLRELIRPWEL